MYCIHSFKLQTAEVLVPQVEDRDFTEQLAAVCDPVLYAYLSKVADTAEKRRYLNLSCTVVNTGYLGDLDTFLDRLHKFEILDLHLSVFHPYDLRVLLAAGCHLYSLWNYFDRFRSDPERSKEFHHESGLWHALVATRYMRFLRTRSHSRWAMLVCS